jgi:prevent-host-death family protein
MSIIMNIQDAKTNLSKLVKLAQGGEEVIIAHRGTPTVKLVPAKTIERELGFLKTDAAYPQPDPFFDPLPEAELQLWEA